ncbi:hypothetical protein IAR50_001136 [Cryptococcus sp. DSM 104548]
MTPAGQKRGQESESSPHPQQTPSHPPPRTTPTAMDEYDSDRYTIQPIDRWDTPKNQHNPTSPPYIAPGEITQEPEVDPLASECSGNW